MPRMILAAALLTLASCDNEPPAVRNVAANEAKNEGTNLTLAPGQSVTFVDGSAMPSRPGQWQVTLAGLDGSGASPPASLCLTAEQASRPPANFLVGRAPDAGCDYENFAFEGNQLFATVRCSAEPPLILVMSGQVTPTSIDLVGGDTAEADTRVTLRRTGDCPG